MPVQDHRGLRVWQCSVDLAVAVYKVTDKFPVDQKFELSRQMRRAAVSIPSNIAEGNGREHRREYLHFLSIARGSTRELSTHFELAKRLGFFSDTEASLLDEQLDHISRMLQRLKARLTQAIPAPRSPLP
ncbi:MAG TPA: four helix bundle protein [Gemmatimonadaceae bacterium]|nr:four helix bundle protein [Gemmatimonadaceae bacterium]